MPDQFKLDPTTINGKYQAHAESTVQTRFENSREDRGLSKKFKSIDEAQKIFYNAVVVLLKNLFITQRANVEVADSRFATVLLNNMSNEQLDSLSDALEDKYDEILALVKKQIDLQLDLPKNGIDLSFKKDLETQIDEAFKTLKDKLAEIKTDGKPPKISDYKQEIKTKIDSQSKFLDNVIGTMSKNFSQISTNFAKANTSLSFISSIKFSENLDKLVNSVSVMSNTGRIGKLSNYFLLNEKVDSVFKDIDRHYTNAIAHYDKDKKRLLVAREDFINTFKRVFFVSFIADFILAPKRFFKKAKSIVGSISASISEWFGDLKWTNPVKIVGVVIGGLSSAVLNIVKFRFAVYKDLTGILLTPVKRMLSMTLNFATFLAKKAIRVVSFTFSKVMSLLNQLLIPKTVLKAAVSFFRTPLGATILGFVIGKIYLFGKNLYFGIRDKVVAAIDWIEKAYDDFSEWFAETKVGKWFSDISDSIEAAGGIFDFLEDSGHYVLEVADKIAHVDFLWILEELKGKLVNLVVSLLGSAAGSLILGGIGAAFGGPIGGAVGSLIGGIVGEKFGGWIANKITGYFQKRKNHDAEFKKAVSFANLGTPIDRITSQYDSDADVVHTIADELLDKFNSMEKNAAGRQALAKQIDYIGNMEKLRKAAFYSETGKFSSFNRQYDALNADMLGDDKETFDNKIKRLRNEVASEINAVGNKNKLDEELDESEVSKILESSLVQYDLFDKTKIPNFGDMVIHPYRFRFARALYIRDLIDKYETENLPPALFAHLYAQLSNPSSLIYHQKIADVNSIWSRYAYITGREIFKAKRNSKDKTIEPELSFSGDDLTKATVGNVFKNLDSILNKIASYELVHIGHSRYADLTETLKKLSELAKLDEKAAELESIGISPSVVKASRKRLEDYLFYLLTNVDPELTRQQQIEESLDFFNKTWIYHLGTLLNTGEFGDSSSKTNFQTLIERQAAKHEMSAEFYEQIKSGAVTSVSQLYKTVPGKDQTPGLGTNMTIQKVEETIEQIDKAVDYVHQRYEKYTDPKNEAELHMKVEDIVNRIRNWHDRNIYPILWAGNPGWAKPPMNPAALDAQ